MMKIGVYPGSFDPLTLGHIDIIARSLALVDKLIIAVGNNSNKTYLFNVQNRVEIIDETLKDALQPSMLNKITINYFDGLLVDFAKEHNATMVIRGIRALSDFDFEFNLAGVNSKLAPDLETIFLMASENHQFISSRFVKEIASFNGDLSKFVPTIVANKLKNIINSNK